MYKTRIEIFTNLLVVLLACFGNKDYKITFWNKIQGYGLRSSDFDKHEGCSRRIFTHWRKYMLERKLIRIPRIKKRQKEGDDTYSSSRNIPYIITPLGICYFSSISGETGFNHVEKMIRFLDYYSSYNLHRDWEKICELIGKRESYEMFKKVCNSININESNNEINVTLSYKTKGRIIYEVFIYKINGRQISLELREDVYTKESLWSKKPISTPTIDEDLFHKDVAEFISETFCYSIIEDCHSKIHKIPHMLNWADLSVDEKSNFENIISKCKNILENLPLETHIMAFNFIGQKTFGTIKQEQELANQIANYFNNTIMPKYGCSFIETGGKELVLFPD